LLTRSGAGEERFLGRIKVVVLTTFDSDDYVYEAIRAGASGFLLKSAPPDTLVQGIRSVSAGDALSEFRARDFGAAVARLGAASASSAPGAPTATAASNAPS
jgi:DNA-binding NarL/FixJ family response regulator